MWYSIQTIFLYAVTFNMADYFICKNENKTNCFSQNVVFIVQSI